MTASPYRTAASVSRVDEPPDLGTLRSRHATLLGGTAVDRHDHGLVVRAGETQRAVRFDAIDELWVVLGANGALEELTLVEFDRTRSAVPASVADFAAILSALDRECLAPLTRDAQAAITRGERLVFGAISLDRDGIEGPGWTHRFRELRTVRVLLGSLVMLHGTLTLDAVELAAIPHPMVFLRLLTRLGPHVEIEGPIPFTPP